MERGFRHGQNSLFNILTIINSFSKLYTMAMIFINAISKCSRMEIMHIDLWHREIISKLFFGILLVILCFFYFLFQKKPHMLKWCGGQRVCIWPPACDYIDRDVCWRCGYYSKGVFDDEMRVVLSDNTQVGMTTKVRSISLLRMIC